MSFHALADLADQNLAHALRLHSRWQPAAKLLELNGVLLHQGTLPLPLPHQNCVLRLDPGVKPEARGAGLAAACTAAVTNLALERGAKGVTLQATHLGEPTYRRLGFREYGRMTRWSL